MSGWSNDERRWGTETEPPTRYCAGGVANVYVGQSLDTVKVKMQTFPHLYTNMFDCFRATFREGGLRALYAGTVPSLAANVAANSVLFAAYGVCQKAVAWAVDAPVIQLPHSTPKIRDWVLETTVTVQSLKSRF